MSDEQKSMVQEYIELLMFAKSIAEKLRETDAECERSDGTDHFLNTQRRILRELSEILGKRLSQKSCVNWGHT